LQTCENTFKDPDFHRMLLLDNRGFMDLDYEVLRRIVNECFGESHPQSSIAPDDMEGIVFQFALGGGGPVVPSGPKHVA
jgi:hypothetical protein